MDLFYFTATPECSQPGLTPCASDQECHHSCPFGDIPAERMACRDATCTPAWYQQGDACKVGAADSCAPTSDGVNDLYCQQLQLRDATRAPGYNQAFVGQGTCQRRTLAATKVMAHNWVPGVPAASWGYDVVPSGAEYAATPAPCTQEYLAHLRSQGLLYCGQNDFVAQQQARQHCSNASASVCGPDKQTHVALLAPGGPPRSYLE